MGGMTQTMGGALGQPESFGAMGGMAQTMGGAMGQPESFGAMGGMVQTMGGAMGQPESFGAMGGMVQTMGGAMGQPESFGAMGGVAQPMGGGAFAQQPGGFGCPGSGFNSSFAPSASQPHALGFQQDGVQSSMGGGFGGEAFGGANTFAGGAFETGFASSASGQSQQMFMQTPPGIAGGGMGVHAAPGALGEAFAAPIPPPTTGSLDRAVPQGIQASGALSADMFAAPEAPAPSAPAPSFADPTQNQYDNSGMPQPASSQASGFGGGGMRDFGGPQPQAPQFDMGAGNGGPGGGMGGGSCCGSMGNPTQNQYDNSGMPQPASFSQASGFGGGGMGGFGGAGAGNGPGDIGSYGCSNQQPAQFAMGNVNGGPQGGNFDMGASNLSVPLASNTAPASAVASGELEQKLAASSEREEALKVAMAAEREAAAQREEALRVEMAAVRAAAAEAAATAERAAAAQREEALRAELAAVKAANAVTPGPALPVPANPMAMQAGTGFGGAAPAHVAAGDPLPADAFTMPAPPQVTADQNVGGFGTAATPMLQQYGAPPPAPNTAPMAADPFAGAFGMGAAPQGTFGGAAPPAPPPAPPAAPPAPPSIAAEPVAGGFGMGTAPLQQGVFGGTALPGAVSAPPAMAADPFTGGFGAPPPPDNPFAALGGPGATPIPQPSQPQVQGQVRMHAQVPNGPPSIACVGAAPPAALPPPPPPPADNPFAPPTAKPVENPFAAPSPPADNPFAPAAPAGQANPFAPAAGAGGGADNPFL